jgi:hypothetical protein
MMKNLNFIKSCLVSFGILLCFGFSNGAAAQPTDAKIKKDLSGAKTVSVTLGKPGTIEWSSTYKKYIWTRAFSAKVKTDEPAVFLTVKGYAAYDVMGGRYVFWRSFISYNGYEGIPDPTAADVQNLIGRFGVEQFMGNYYFNRVIGKIESITLSSAPEFEWHTPNSVSFNVIAVYNERTNDIGGRERVARTFRIRLYRDNTKVEWKNMMSTPKTVEKL